MDVLVIYGFPSEIQPSLSVCSMFFLVLFVVHIYVFSVRFNQIPNIKSFLLVHSTHPSHKYKFNKKKHTTKTSSKIEKYSRDQQNQLEVSHLYALRAVLEL